MTEKQSCLGCKFLIREDKPECFLHYLVRIDKKGDPCPVEKCGRRGVLKPWDFLEIENG